MSGGLFAPMVVAHNNTKYVAEAVLAGGFPAFSKVELKQEKLNEREVHVKSDVNGVLLLLRPLDGKIGWENRFIVVPAIECEFVRYVKTCVMCNAPREDGGAGE
jgi:hypothetical protein